MRHFTFAGCVAGLLLAATSAFAQAPTSSLKDGVYRKGGLTMRLQAGQSSRLSAPVKMSNGLTIRPDGIMVSKDGTRQILEEGKAVNMQGQIVNFSDDMMSDAAIQQRARQVAGVTETRVSMPVAGPVPQRLANELARTERRLALLQQLADKLSARAAAAAGPAVDSATLDAQIKAIDDQLK